MRWNAVLRVADHELELPDAQQRQLAQLIEDAGPLGIVGHNVVALMFGVRGGPKTDALTSSSEFPAPVATFRGRSVWDVRALEAHRDGQPKPKRGWTAGSIDDRLMTSGEVTEVLRVPADSFIAQIHRQRWHLVPKPAGQVSSAHYWLREDFERWLMEHPERRPENRRRSKDGRVNRPAKTTPTEAKKPKTSR